MDFMSKQTNLHTWLTKASQSYLKISCCSYFKTDCGEWNFLGDQLYLTYSGTASEQTMKLFPLSVRTKKCTTIAKKWMASCNGKNKSFKGKSSRWNTLLRVGRQNANWES